MPQKSIIFQLVCSIDSIQMQYSFPSVPSNTTTPAVDNVKILFRSLHTSYVLIYLIKVTEIVVVFAWIPD
jgi:hypothetical protein